jgi:hypothetical protein
MVPRAGARDAVSGTPASCGDRSIKCCDVTRGDLQEFFIGLVAMLKGETGVEFSAAPTRVAKSKSTRPLNAKLKSATAR